MAKKVGRLVEFERVGRKFVRFRLDTGERVEVPHHFSEPMSTYHRAEVLVFVGRRGTPFSYVHWVGTPEKALAAFQEDQLSEREMADVVKAPRERGWEL